MAGTMTTRPMGMRLSSNLVELRGEISADDMAVIDAIVQATPGANRMTVIRHIISKYCEQKIHESTLIQRVRRGNGTGGEA